MSSGSGEGPFVPVASVAATASSHHDCALIHPHCAGKKVLTLALRRQHDGRGPVSGQRPRDPEVREYHFLRTGILFIARKVETNWDTATGNNYRRAVAIADDNAGLLYPIRCKHCSLR